MTKSKNNGSGNDLSDEDVKLIGESLKKNTTLKELCLSDNNIGCEGTKHISLSIRNNKTLVTLHLSS